jgi:hypothetical protein
MNEKCESCGRPSLPDHPESRIYLDRIDSLENLDPDLREHRLGDRYCEVGCLVHGYANLASAHQKLKEDKQELYEKRKEVEYWKQRCSEIYSRMLRQKDIAIIVCFALLLAMLAMMGYGPAD